MERSNCGEKMDEKELKTSTKQRVIIGAIAIIMLGSMIAGYAAIVINGSKSKSNSSNNGVDEAKVAQYTEEYEAKQAELAEATKSDFDKFVKYKGEVKAYNESAANDGGVQTKDIEKGSGDKLGEGDNNYLAYYIGWCADESVFDSVFDNNSNPTKFESILDPAAGMIEGWNVGVVGMRLGGVREITIPGELAYGESREICGGTNKPLKFLVMAVAKEDPLKTIASELTTAQTKLQYAYYGLDYDEVMKGGSENK